MKLLDKFDGWKLRRQWRKETVELLRCSCGHVRDAHRSLRALNDGYDDVRAGPCTSCGCREYTWLSGGDSLND